jgi:hypothetical protein
LVGFAVGVVPLPGFVRSGSGLDDSTGSGSGDDGTSVATVGTGATGTAGVGAGTAVTTGVAVPLGRGVGAVRVDADTWAGVAVGPG